jgi:hypothetical protein
MKLFYKMLHYSSIILVLSVVGVFEWAPDVSLVRGYFDRL